MALEAFWPTAWNIDIVGEGAELERSEWCHSSGGSCNVFRIELSNEAKGERRLGELRPDEYEHTLNDSHAGLRGTLRTCNDDACTRSLCSKLHARMRFN